MKIRKILVVPVSILFTASCAFAQNRISDHNSIGWYTTTATIRLKDKWSLHTEYQWRRDDIITSWQQSLLRLGINYQANPSLQLRLGYGWIETFAYGDIPINAFGKQFTEHRIFETATVSGKIGRSDISHRFMLEQRWLGRYSDPLLDKEDDYVFSNRARYMFRWQHPLKGNAIGDKTPYAAVYDEIFIGFGKNVGENVFDQNRIGILLGYRFSSKFRVEAGFLNQTVQLSREVNNKNVFQYNNGLILSTAFNL